MSPLWVSIADDDDDDWDDAGVERAARRLWTNQHRDRTGAFGPLTTSWQSIPETRKRWWRLQARECLAAYHDPEKLDEHRNARHEQGPTVG